MSLQILPGTGPSTRRAARLRLPETLTPMAASRNGDAERASSDDREVRILTALIDGTVHF